MSRSSSAITALGLVLGCSLLLPPSSAAAAPGDAEAPVLPITAPVLPITAPVLDISFGEADLKREAEVEKVPRRTKITLDSSVLFAKDSPKINSKARGRLNEVAADLSASGPGRLTITGYTDDLGSAAHGRTLSKQRADAVSTVLRKTLPTSSYPFTVKGRGEKDPAVPNTSESNRKKNRRVVIVYTRA